MTTPTIEMVPGASVDVPASRPHRRPTTPQLVEAASLLRSAFGGDQFAMLRMKRLLGADVGTMPVQESMSTSDFPILLGDVFDREMLAQYEQIAPVWPQFARRTTVRDFRPKRYVDLIGGRGILEPVPELGEYPARSVDEALYELTVGKYGARIPLSWEMLVNDDLGAFNDLPVRLAQASRDTEDVTATGLVASATGPNPGFFNADNGNLLAGNPALTETSAEAALTAISTRRDQEGRPIIVRSAILMVPPALQTTADRIVGASEVREEIDGRLIVRSNPMAGRVRVVVNPWLASVDTSDNVATTWYLLPDPSSPRPAAIVGFLTGHEVPELRLRADTGQRVGGGQVAPTDGSFDTDDIQYRARHVVGGATLEPIATAVSLGTGG